MDQFVLEKYFPLEDAKNNKGQGIQNNFIKQLFKELRFGLKLFLLHLKVIIIPLSLIPITWGIRGYIKTILPRIMHDLFSLILLSYYLVPLIVRLCFPRYVTANCLTCVAPQGYETCRIHQQIMGWIVVQQQVVNVGD